MGESTSWRAGWRRLEEGRGIHRGRWCRSCPVCIHIMVSSRYGREDNVENGGVPYQAS